MNNIKMKVFFNSIFIILLLTHTVFGQKKTDGIVGKELQKKLKMADILFEEHSYYNASDFYLDLAKIAPQNEYLLYKLGITYFKSRDYENAEVYLRKIAELKKDKTLYPDAIFHLAEALKVNGKYDEAKKFFLLYLKTKGTSTEDKFYKSLTRNEIKSCDYALEMIDFDTISNIKVALLPGEVNNAYSDFAPYKLNEDTLIFSSLRSDSIITLEYGSDEVYPIKLYQSVKENSEWTEPREFKNFNHPYDHSANGTYSPDKKHFYFTRCKPDKGSRNICSIYTSELKDGKWSEPEKLKNGINLKGYNSTQPAFGTTTKGVGKKKVESYVLYFVSDRPGGKGNKDIWYSSVNEKGDYTQPVNCGMRVNTIRDEITPHYDNESKSLYFSSNYHLNAGGFDVFKSEGSLSRWTKPVNVGFPVNSSYDDFYYQPPKTSSTGFIVSNRKGGMALKSATCCDDIYQINKIDLPQLAINGFSRPENPSKPKVLVGVAVGIIPKGRIKSHLKTYQSVKYLKDSIEWVDSTDISGKFSFTTIKSKNYSLIFAKDSFEVKIFPLDSIILFVAQRNLLLEVILPDAKDTNNVRVFSNELPKMVSLKKSASEAESITKFTSDIKKNVSAGDVFLLDKISFETGKDLLSKETIKGLDILLKFLSENPKLKIEISGHTDSQGTDKFNLDLSQKRASRIVEYLTSKGINKKRMVAMGYGENQPLAPNENPDGTDNPEGRKLNRRTEIKILEEIEE